MALKGVIQGQGGGQQGQLSGSGVTSVALAGPSPFITGPPVTSAGTLTFDFSGTAIPVADGGTGANNFTSNAVVLTGPSSTAPLTSVVLPQQSSEFLNGLGVFAVPAGGGGGAGTVTSVDLAMSSELRISGNPVTGAGVLVAGWVQPLNVGHGGTGLGSVGVGAVLRGGLTSTAPFQGTPLTNLTSTFLDGTGNFSTPPTPTGGGTGTVTSVDLSMSSEFRISGNPISGAGTLVAGFIQPVAIAHGGTAMGSFGPGVVMGGLTSTGPLQGLPLTNLTSTFLRGDGVFGVPPSGGGGGTGTVTSVDMTTPPEFVVSGNPITLAGTLALARISPSSVSAGGTGVGAFTSNALIQAGLSSTGAFRSLALNQQTSTFLDGTGTFRIIPYPPTAGTGTVTSVDIAVPPGLTVSGNPITVSGTMTIGVISPSSVSAGGTGMGSFGPSVILGGLTSTGPLRGLPLTNLTSQFLAGDGSFSIPVNPGGTVQSVSISMTSEFAIQRNQVTGSGTIDIGFVQPLAVAHGGTGLGSFGIGAIVKGGLSSTGPLQGLPLTNLTSNFLAGDGIFRIPPTNIGTVTSVDLSLSSEFVKSGNPISMGSGTITIGWRAPLSIAHGGTGLGSIGIGAVLRGGLTSTDPMQGTPLTNLTSTFLDGTGNFSVPPAGGGGPGGGVTSVALQLSSEFNVTGSPITTSGTLMGSWAFQSPHLVFAGPTSVSPGTPSFRVLISDDLPQSISGKTFTSNTYQNPTISSQTLVFGSSIKWNMNSGAIAFIGMDSTARGMMDTPANLPNAGTAILRIQQLGTGLQTMRWTKYWKFESGSPPTLSSGFTNIDIITLYMESTAAYGVARKKFL